MSQTRLRVFCHLSRRRLTALAVAVASITTIALSTSPASAATNGGPDCLNQPKTGHCYAITEFTAPSGLIGAHIAMALLPMNTGGSSIGSVDYHVNNTLWVIFPGDNNYIEAGLADGFAPPNNWNDSVNGSCPDKKCLSYSYDANSGGSPQCYQSGCGAYFLYWEDHNQVGGIDYNYVHIVRFVSPTPSVTQYIDILWNYHSDNQWAINFSGYVSQFDESGIDDAWHSPQYIEAGGEVAAPSGALDCAVQTTDTVGLWHPGLTIKWPSTPADSENTHDSRFEATGTSNGSGWWTWGLNIGNNGC
jgi:hypothetical protein